MKVERIQLPTPVVYSGSSEGARVSAANDAPDKRRNGRQMQQQAEQNDARPEGEASTEGSLEEASQPASASEKHLLDITA